MSDQDENLLLRWSRRKAEASRAKPAEPPAKACAAPAPDAAAASAPAKQQVVALADGAPQPAGETPAIPAEELPDVETLTYESDFSVFMGDGVPDMIKRRALRKLWTSNPLLANLDGLNDYDPGSMTFWTELEAAGEQVAATSRQLHDKIMEAKHERHEQRHRRRMREGERRVARAADETPAAPADQAAKPATEPTNKDGGA